MTIKLASVEGGVPGLSTARGPVLHAVAATSAAQSLRNDDSSNWNAHADNDVGFEGVLTRAGFLRMVRREKRRTDRSHSALSLAMVEIGGAETGARDAALERIGALVRETDYIAPIDHDGIAVLLPDTGEAGLERFLDKISLAGPTNLLSTVGATYPGDSFDRLVAERMGTSHVRRAVGEEPALPNAAAGYPFKRCLDVVGSMIALILLSPLMLIVALAIKLTSPGPVIFRQQRIGQGGVPFNFYKFRSMRTDSDDRVHREFVTSLIDGKGVAATDDTTAGRYKMKVDPRVTAIGRLIRKTSIDELPQFYNVLIGDMSLVGPRPPVAYEAERYKGWHRRRVFELKPGLTGIWQVEGRSRVSFDDMVRMDLRYLQRCSLHFDLAILLRTVGVVITCQGAR